MIPFTEDLSSFYATIYGGLAIGLLFDINRSLKSNFKILKYFSIVFNIIFWILATIIIFITVNAIESFDLRYYHFVALLIGFLLYYKENYNLHIYNLWKFILHDYLHDALYIRRYIFYTKFIFSY